MGEPEEGSARGFAARRRRALERVERARLDLGERRKRSGPLDALVRIYERDRESFGSVLGSAVAFRLFLFVFALVAVSIGVGVLVLGRGWFGDGLSDDLGITGTIAAEIDEALRQNDSVGLLLVLAGLVTTAWAGRNLAVTLSAASANAWRIPRPSALASVRAVGVVIALIAVVMVLASVLRLVRSDADPILVATSFLAVFVAYTAVWFGLTLVLPRAARDPTSLIPGALLTGVTFAALSWVSQFVFAPRLESSSEVLGGLGIAAVALGWLFVASRIMVASLAANAVLYELYGSLLGLLLTIPGLRRLRDRRVIRRLLDAEPAGQGGSASQG